MRLYEVCIIKFLLTKPDKHILQKPSQICPQKDKVSEKTRMILTTYIMGEAIILKIIIDKIFENIYPLYQPRKSSTEHAK